MTASDLPTWDFLVIGAQKAGTTTLHHLLVDHPRLRLPAEKEAPVFHRSDDPEVVARHVRDALDGDLDGVRGKATPQYMCIPGTAARIARVNPQVRLVALLRDPVERARSHWQMRTRFRTDQRTFADAVRDLLDDPPPADEEIPEEDGYLRFGEYGRILAEYRDHFPAESFLLLHMDELSADPLGVVGRVTAHLGVEPHTPAALGERFNVASRPSRFPRLERALWRAIPYDRAWAAFTPAMRQRAGLLLDRFEVNRPSPGLDPSLPEPLHERLVAHFEQDVARLRGLDLHAPDVTVGG